MGTLFRKTPNNGYPFPPKWPLKMGTGLAASAAHPRPNNIWVPPPPPPGMPLLDDNQNQNKEWGIYVQKVGKYVLEVEWECSGLFNLKRDQ